VTVCVVAQNPNHHVEHGQVCAGCTQRIRCDLDDIVHLYLRLDLQPGSGNHGPRVTGSREAPLPLRVDALDLTMPARGEGLTAVGKEPDPDGVPLQVGQPSVASTLDLWVRDWREVRDRGEGLPTPTVAVLVGWLTVRLDWACDEHPAVDEFAGEIRRLRNTLRREVGDVDPRPERLPAPCPACDLLAMVRDSDGVRCRNCRTELGDDEYADWVGRLARDARMAA